MSFGCSYYIGRHQSGKTSLALKHAMANSAADGNPILIFDPNRAWNFSKFPHTKSVDETCKMIWGDGRHCAVTFDDFPFLKEYNFKYSERLCAAIHSSKRVHVIIDELFYFVSSRSVPEQFQALARSTQHAQAHLYLTTQHYGDLPYECVADANEMFIFSSERTPRLEELVKRKGLDMTAIENQAQGAHTRIVFGFST